ncbi:hypothetical protein [Shewanella sp. YIC-542]|uniref:hypothetical protein n=1 Tax=Shewanella mytili TaxID=3377111 RepID=UPI00398EEBC3
MHFERFQTHQHNIAGSILDVSYDRLTTKFELRADGSVVYSKYLWCWPKHRAVINMGGGDYLLKVYRFLLWGAKLSDNDALLVKELLPKRRRRSIVFLGYGVFILLLRGMLVAFPS